MFGILYAKVLLSSIVFCGFVRCAVLLIANELVMDVPEHNEQDEAATQMASENRRHRANRLLIVSRSCHCHGSQALRAPT